MNTPDQTKKAIETTNASNETVCRRWIDDKIEELNISYLESKIEALERNSKDDRYAKGVSDGAAIIKKAILFELRDLKHRLRDNSNEQS